MTRDRRQFTTEFKRAAVRLAEGSRSLSTVAGQLGVRAAYEPGGRNPPAAAGSRAAQGGARDFRESNSLLGQGIPTRYAFIARSSNGSANGARS